MGVKTSGRAAFGSILERSADIGTATNFATVPEIFSSTPAGRTPAFEEATTHESSRGFAEHVQTIIDVGPMQFDLNFVPTDPMLQSLYDDQEAGTLRYYRIRLGRNPTKALQGLAMVGGLVPGAAGVRGKLQIQLTLQPSGPWDLVDIA